MTHLMNTYNRLPVASLAAKARGCTTNKATNISTHSRGSQLTALGAHRG